MSEQKQLDSLVHGNRKPAEDKKESLQLISLIGQGSSSRVWKAQDRRTK